VASAGQGPFGMKFGRAGILLSAEAGSNSVSSYVLTSSDTLAVVSGAVPNGQQATCWISLTGDGIRFEHRERRSVVLCGEPSSLSLRLLNYWGAQ